MKYKRPTKLAAPEYVDALMNWAQGLLDNEEVFPNKIGEHGRALGRCAASSRDGGRGPISQELPGHDPHYLPPSVPGVRAPVQQPF